MADFKTRLHHFIANQFPDHIRADHPMLVQFVEAYYRFLDEPNGAGNLLLNSDDWQDIDTTLTEFIPKFRNQYAVDIPNSALMDGRRLIKRINEYYEAKGSENATKMFFRFMFDVNATVQYPGDFILRASDGKWTKRRVIKVDTSAFTDQNIYEIKNSTIQLNYIEFIPNQGRIIRSVTTSCLNVTRQIEPNIYLLEVTINKDYQFPPLISEVANFDINGDGEPETFNSLGDYDTHVYVVKDSVVYGSISKQIVGVDSIIDPGNNFRIDDAYVIGQTGIEGRYFVLEGPAGYVDDPEGPYVFEQFDNNAIIRVSRLTENDTGISQIRLINTGQKFLAREVNTTADVSYFVIPTNPVDAYVVNDLNPGEGPNDYATDTQELQPVNTFSITLSPRAPRNLDGEQAEIVFRTGLIYEQPGTFKDSSGFLSDVNKLQDNYFYQPYSYVVKVSIPRSEWEQAFLKSNHPAGFKMFSIMEFRDIINANVSVSDYLNVFADPITVELFQGMSVIATRTLSPGESWMTFDFTLTSEELALITDPNDLEIRIRLSNADTPIQISQVSLELVGS